MKNHLITLLLFLGIIMPGLIAQNPYIQVAGVSGCSGNQLLLSVNIEDFEGIGALTLFMEYDSTIVDFIGIENIHPQFAGMIFNPILSSSAKIGISWSNVVGQSLEEESLFEMRFLYKGGTCNISFTDACETANTNLQIVNVDYLDGWIIPIISVSGQPEDVTVNQPDSAQFSVSATGSSSFQWQVSLDGGEIFANMTNSINVQGVFTQELQLLNTETIQNGNLYRCMLSEVECVAFSNVAYLTVLPQIYSDAYSLNEGWGSLSSYINPDDPQLENLFQEILQSVEILVSGDEVFYPQGDINTIGAFDPYKGYAIKMLANANLEITGYKIDNASITVPQGWSYLPVIIPCDVAIAELPAEFIQQIVIIQEIAGTNLYWPEKEISSLTVLQNGRSYLILVEQPVTFTFPGCN